MIGISKISISQTVSGSQGLFETVQRFIIDHFGQSGLYAAYLLAAAMAALLAYKILKLSFEIILFVVLPSAITAFILSRFLPYDFYHMLPVTASLFTLGLLLRHVVFARA